MRSHIAVLSAALILLTGCGAVPESQESRNEAIASCGALGRLIAGEVEIDVSNHEEVTEILKTLSEKAPGEVRTTAKFILEQSQGVEKSESDSEKQLEKFKDYCKNYTVG